MHIAIDAKSLALTQSDQKRVIENLTELYDRVLDTMAQNTKKAYFSDFNQYLQFCNDHDLPSMASDHLITKKSIELYFDHLMDRGYVQHNAKQDKSEPEITRFPYKHHAIKRKLASIKFFIGVAELPCPFANSKLLRMYVKGRLKEKPAAQAQAPAMTVQLVEEITSQLNDDSLMMLRNLAVLNVGVDTLFRASNLVAIELDHIDWIKGTAYAPYSKTDQSGEGHHGYLSKHSIKLLRQWVERAQIQDGFLFRALSPKQTVQNKPITTRTLWGIYKTLGKKIDSQTNWSCHSTRTGAVISMVENEVPLVEIMKHGNWKSSAMPVRYSAQYNAATTGMARIR